jgi:hypothetical protein
LLLDGSRAVCVEGIRNVIVKGPPGAEKIIVKIERQIGAVREAEAESDVRKRIWATGENDEAHTSIVENRDLVFMRDKTPVQLSQDKAEFSQASRMIKCGLSSLISQKAFANENLALNKKLPRIQSFGTVSCLRRPCSFAFRL